MGTAHMRGDSPNLPLLLRKNGSDLAYPEQLKGNVMFKKFIVSTCLTTIFTLAPTLGLASNQALYGTAIPDDAVFIRWMGTPEQATSFGAQFAPELAAGSDYLPISARHLPDAEQGAFYSVIDGTLVQEPARDDPAKVHLILVNADQGSARVLLAGKDAQVIGETARNAANARAVNPVQAVLAVMLENTLLGEFDLTLRRGQNVTFFVQDGVVHLIQNGFAPVATPN
jgi:hypothetical protein